MEIEIRKIDTLQLDSKNARMHDAVNLDAITRSLEKFGQRKPIVVNQEGKVVAGNGTLLAAKKLDWEEIAVVVLPKTWSEEEQQAYAIADNRTNELSRWDNEQLLDTIESLPDDLVLAAGFTQENLDALVKAWGEVPSFESLLDEHGEPTEEDGMIRISFLVPVDVADKWAVAIENAGEDSEQKNIIACIDSVYKTMTEKLA